MNLSIIARVINDVKLEDLEAGDHIVEQLNASLGKEVFEITDDGKALLSKYRSLKSGERLLINDVKLIEHGELNLFIRQVDFIQKSTPQPKESLSLKYQVYIITVLLMFLTLVMTLVAYYIMLSHHNDRSVSYIITLLGTLLDLYKDISQ